MDKRFFSNSAKSSVTFFKKTFGFTLIEILIVMAILGLMSSVLIVAINPLAQQNKGRDAERKSNLHQIQSALEFYRTDAGTYPLSITCDQPLSYTSGGNTTTYLDKVPCDPSGDIYEYQYISPSGNQTYCIRACLQNSSDVDIDEQNPLFSPDNNPTQAKTGCNMTLTCDGEQSKSYTLLNP